ncbi:MAG: hypothetical protein CMN38_02780 [SAR116 cluster bacterium]|nr:hypothetical protein [SAR116 cluster bacterium]
MMISTLKKLLVLLWLTLPVSAMAQIGIVATVNGKPITNYDVEQRLLFLQYATNIAITDANRERLTNDALQLLIDDMLKTKAAEDAIPDLGALLLPQVRDLIDQNFGTDTKSGSRVISDLGIDPITVQIKYLGDLAWSNYISTKFASRFEKVDTQVDDELERIRINASKPQLQLGEIILVPGPSRTLEQTAELAEEMVAAIRKGANFAEVARQYSASGSASRGGDIGWIIVDKLAPPFREALADVENGGVSAPVLVDGTIYIFRRVAERKDGLADASQSRVWLARALLPLDADATEADRLELAARLRRDTADATSCDDILALNESYGTGAQGNLDNILIADLAPQMRKLLLSLTPDKPSEPLAFAEGIVTLMLCRVERPQIQMPPREDIRQMLIDRAFGSLAERQLLRERRTAIIEYPGQS